MAAVNGGEIEVVAPGKSDFMILDNADEAQILAADDAAKQAFYHVIKTGGRTVTQVSLMGIKECVYRMSQKGQPLVIKGEGTCEIVRIDPEDKKTWVWQASITFKNEATGLESQGMSEAPVYDPRGTYDPFGRTKAMSKAERNAQRKQIPEMTLLAMLKAAQGGEGPRPRTFERASEAPPAGPLPRATEAQFQRLAELGHDVSRLRGGFLSEAGANDMIGQGQVGPARAAGSERLE